MSLQNTKKIFIPISCYILLCSCIFWKYIYILLSKRGPVHPWHKKVRSALVVTHCGIFKTSHIVPTCLCTISQRGVNLNLLFLAALAALGQRWWADRKAHSNRWVFREIINLVCWSYIYFEVGIKKIVLTSSKRPKAQIIKSA